MICSLPILENKQKIKPTFIFYHSMKVGRFCLEIKVSLLCEGVESFGFFKKNLKSENGKWEVENLR